MLVRSRRTARLMFVMPLIGALPFAASAAPDTKSAAAVFAEAMTLCGRDAGAMWGKTLCGPIFIVDYTDRHIVANQADAQGVLKKVGDHYEGTLPEQVIIANTPTEWSGTRWTQLVSPLPEDAHTRSVLIAHELFHRIQPSLGLSRPEVDNGHLDTFDGRYLLQLEWRALARALEASAEPVRRAAIGDAIAFRRERYRMFPKAAASEALLEINEGLPEYTGVKLGLSSPVDQVAHAIRDLKAFAAAPTFVRSFAYATGPAYGLLLDSARPGWFRNAGEGPGLADALEASLDLQREVSSGDLAERIASYDDGLRAREDDRERKRQALLSGFRQRLIEGPVVTLQLEKANFQFNPQTLSPLDDIGTVYPTVRVTDRWGSLEVERDGALVRRQPFRVIVSALGATGDTREANGWRLSLNPGWRLQAGERPGDFVLECEICDKK